MPKCPYYQRVRINRALRYKVKDTCFIDKKTNADIFMATKCLNCTLALNNLNHGNLIVTYHTLGEICTSNHAKILTALKHCLVSSAIVTVTVTSLNYGNRTHMYSLSALGLKLLYWVFFNAVRKTG